jgi:hypothetical protein
MKLIEDPTVKLKYQHLITNSFVECNRLMRWCPAPDCTNAIKVQYFDAQLVKCLCSHQFCFGCGELWHDPVKCKWLKKWIKKCDDDSETSNWIAANTKECPKCHVTIEKVNYFCIKHFFVYKRKILINPRVLKFKFSQLFVSGQNFGLIKGLNSLFIDGMPLFEISSKKKLERNRYFTYKND